MAIIKVEANRCWECQYMASYGNEPIIVHEI